MTKVTVFIERGLDESVREFFEGVVPIGLTSEGVIKNGRVPFVAGCKDDVRKSLEFQLGVRLHFEIRQSVDDVKGHDVAVIGANALSAADFHGPVIDLVLVSLELSGRVYRAEDSVICVLTEDADDGTALRGNFGGGVDDLEGIHFVVVNAGNVDFTRVDVDYDSIITDDTAISSPVHEGSAFLAGVLTNTISVPRYRTSCYRRHHALGLVRCPEGYVIDSYVS